MKNTAKKLLALLLCLVMVVSLFPVSALAEGADEGEPIAEEGCTGECGHDHEHEGEEPEEPEDPAGDGTLDIPEDPVGDGALDVPEEEIDPDLVRVEFICDPADAVITVYDPMNLDENGDPLVVDPEEDGSYLLYPGEYLYDAAYKGICYREKAPFLVESSSGTDSPLVISVELAFPELFGAQFPMADLVTATTEGISSSFLDNCSASYKSGPYYTKLAALNLPNDVASKLVAVANSQIGYHEGNNWDDISGTSVGT